MRIFYLFAASGTLLGLAQGQDVQVEVRSTPILQYQGKKFKDHNRNGKLDAYEDWRLPADRRVADLITQMSAEEKVGLMIHSSLAGFTGPNGEVLGVSTRRGARLFTRSGAGAEPNRALDGKDNPLGIEPMDEHTPAQLIRDRHIRWILVRPTAGEAPERTARFHNSLQEMAESTRLGIPLVISTDPRHGPGPSYLPNQPTTSRWPDQLGLAATRDIALVRRFGEIAAKELHAMGIRCLLGPMADIATEPRWNRITGTFGEDPQIVTEYTRALIKGFQGDQLGPSSVMTVVKHFPGNGPVKDGYDPHNYFGKWTIYPANNFDQHLSPFQAAFEAGAGGVMGGYFIPVGKDTKAINFSRAMIEGLLRSRMQFDGIVVTDWLRNMPWGVEKMSEKERQRTMVLAGVDQIGGDNDPKYILAGLKDSTIPPQLVDAAARRVLTQMFRLGVFENPYAPEAAAKSVVGSREFVDLGHSAQMRSTVLLRNEGGHLPVAAGKKVFVSGINAEAASSRSLTVVPNMETADAIVMRVSSPATTFPYGGLFAPGGAGGGRPAGPPAAIPAYGITLAYSNAANWMVLDDIRKAAATGKPVIVAVDMDKPVILTEFIDKVAGVLAVFGATDGALLDIVTGKQAPSGKLPFDLPSDMPSVLAQAADLAFDMDDPLFKCGFGLTYAAKR
jgi:beta-glucosidase